MTAHIPIGLLGRYAGGNTDIAPDVLWAMEAHLEECAACRDRLAEVGDVETATLLTSIWTDVDAAVSATTPPPARR